MSVFPARPVAVDTARCAACILAAALYLFPPGVRSQDLLSFDDALRAAQQRSRQLPAHDATAAAAREMAVAAGQLPDPVLKGGLVNLPVDGPDRFTLTRDFMTMRAIGISQDFTRADKRSARSARFDREAELAQAAGATALADLQRETAVAWLERHHRERMFELMQSLHAEAQLQVAAADAAFRGGRGSQADAFAARSAVAEAADRLLGMQRDIATATTRLARWVGARAGQGLGRLPDLKTLPPELGAAGSAIETALEDHPRIGWLLRKEALARADAEVAQREKAPDWSAELMFSQRGPAYSNMVSLTVSIPWRWDPGKRQDRELAARLALVQRERDEREEALREVLAGARATLQSWQSNLERQTHYETTLIPLAAERLRAALSAYRGGSGALGAVLDARRTEIEARLERLRIEMETADLWAQLITLVPARSGTAMTTEQRP